MIVFLLLLFSTTAHAEPKPDQGWHWYQIEKPKKEQPKEPPQTMEAYRKAVQESLDNAILNPTPANIATYIRQQKELMDRSMEFAQTWQKVLLTNPELNPDIEHPVTQKGRHVYLDERNKKTSKIIQEMAKTYGLFFFFKSDCPYCHAFAPIVKRFSETYGWKVLAISLDGSKLEDFPNAQKDNGTARRLGVYEKGVPALMAVNPKDEAVIPLSYGFISETQLMNNIRLWIEGGGK